MDQSQILLTLTQSLHLAALAPCILVVFYLLATSQLPILVIVPILFFSGLAVSLAMPLTYAFSITDLNWENLQYIADLTLPIFSFLLITQFFLNRLPPLPYWLLLAVPFIIAFPAIRAIWQNQDICLDLDICVESISLLKIAFVVTGALVMMLITATLSRLSLQLDLSPHERMHKYRLIISIIALNLCLLALELLSAGDLISHTNYALVKIILKLGFIYVILISVFQIYSEAFAIDQAYSVTYHHKALSEREKQLAEQIKHLFEKEKPFLEIGFKRRDFAKRLDISEHQLSRIVNLRFHKSISELINEYRIDAAKKYLTESDNPITNIAFDVGFNSITSFNRVFKQFVDCSPTQYREQYKL